MARQIINTATLAPIPLRDLLLTHTNCSISDIDRLLWQGSVWQGSKRLRDPNSFPIYGFMAPEISVWHTLYPIEEYTLESSQITYEDEHFLAVWKPSGLNTAQSVYSEMDCLTWGLDTYLKQRGHSYAINTINRLDRDTQGLVLYGKDKASEKALYALFMNRQVRKYYLVRSPNFPQALTHYCIRDTFEYQGKLQAAETHVRRIIQHNTKCFWLAMPYTGRTHQIRKHFTHYLKPIDGDLVYGGQEAEELMLACIGYTFTHPFSKIKCRIRRFPAWTPN